MENVVFGFNELDFAILGIALLSGIFSYFRGFSWEVINLFSWLLTLAAVWYLSWAAGPLVSELMVNYLGWSLPYFVVVGISGIIVFLGVTLILGSATSLIFKNSLDMHMGFIDRLLGFVYGAMRGFLLLVGIFFIYAWFVDESNYHKIVKSAQFFIVLKDITEFIKDSLSFSSNNV